MKTAKKSYTKKPVTASKIDMKDVFFNQILEKIDSVNADEWEHYIKDSFDLLPRNAFTNYRYRGLNRLNLMLNCKTSPLYATFKQISDRGGKVKKGTKGSLIEYFTFCIKHKENGKIITSKEYRELTSDQKQDYYSFPMNKFYTVFNMDDVDTTDMDFSLEVIETPEEEEIELNVDIESFITNIIDTKGLKIEEKMQAIACYRPSTDMVLMPSKEICVSLDRYYATLFHEIIHWTGAPNRLNRVKGSRFGDAKYSFEELIAELGSMLLCLNFDITSEFINSLRYIKGWSKATEENRTSEFKKAFIQSQTAVSFLTK